MQNPPSPLDTLRQLKEMLDAGALSPTEFEALKQRLVFSELPTASPLPLPPAINDMPSPPAVPAPVAFEAVNVVPPYASRFEAVEPSVTPSAAPFSVAPDLVPVSFPEPLAVPVSEWPSQALTEKTDVLPARSSPLGLIIAIGAVLAFLAVVAYLSMNRPSSEHISSTSQTAADSLAATIETGPQAEPLPQTITAVPETVRVVPAHPAPALLARPPAAVRDSAETTPVPTATDSAARQ